MSMNAGMDVTQVQQLAGQMGKAGEAFTRLGSELTAQLGQTQWEGPDKVAFTGAWEQQNAQLKAASTLLQDAQAGLMKEAQAQLDASGT